MQNKFSFLNIFKSKPATKEGPKTFWQAWGDPLLFAVVAATIIRWLLLEAFTIPTTSMESTLMAGDFLFVSKLHYGPRTPQTPLQVPLTHQTLPILGTPSYSTLIQLPMARLWGFSKVTPNDVVVFNFPGDLQFPVDLRTNYIKRCVAGPGDTVQVLNRELLVNNKPFPKPERMQHSYFIITDGRISKDEWTKLDVTEYQEMDNGTGYMAFLSEAMFEELKKLPMVKSIDPIVQKPEFYDGSVFPQNEKFRWTMDFFGKLWVPREGDTIPLTEDNLILYGKTIANYDDPDHIKFENNQILYDGKPLVSYTFKQNYYWMMGDNRHNSSDSRVFGFVPANHIVGKAVFVWLALNKSDKVDKFARWDRMMRQIK